jgi:predicted Abi (CAAX) family protease
MRAGYWDSMREAQLNSTDVNRDITQTGSIGRLIHVFTLHGKAQSTFLQQLAGNRPGNMPVPC